MLHRLSMLALTSVVGCFAQAAEPIGELVWFHSDFPPISVINGPFRGQGAADQWGSFLMQSLPEFRHTLMAANTLRLQEEMKRRDNACNRAFLKTPEREKFFLFSDPLVNFLPNGLITLRSNKAELEPFLNEHGELKLKDLVAAQKFQIATAAGRSFGQIIDQALQAGKVVQFTASDLFSSGLLQVANHQGVDAVMGFAIELTWATKRFDLDPTQFWFIPIEGENALIPVYIACSRSETGGQVITRINELIRSGKATELAARAYREWLPDDIAHYYDRQRKQADKRAK